MAYRRYYSSLYFVDFDVRVNCRRDLVYEDYFFLLGLGVD